jgi:F-type H+-transporting ATPase subunit epsilon
VILSDDVDQINVPGADGRLGILPRHQTLLTTLAPGEMTIIKKGEVTPFAISGGFMEVLPDRVTILADTVERADEIDEARAEETRRRAEELLKNRQSIGDQAAVELALRKSLVRLNVARRRREGRGMGGGPQSS